MRISRSTPGTQAPEEWVTGATRIDPVEVPEAAAHLHVDSVDFAAGARTVWHRHPAGQTLIITAGVGHVQHRGGPLETLHVGDSVLIEPGEWHWHGATATAAMTHLALEPDAQDGTRAEAGVPVTEHEYFADGSGERPDPLPVTRTVVLDQALTEPWHTGRVEIRRITIAPGHASGLHVHNGPVFGSIEAGSAVYQIEGEPVTVLHPGDTFYEPAGIRIARFDAQEHGVTFLGYFLLNAGQEAEIEFPTHSVQTR
ncbi:cupin domain-containing protein [Actinospica robiniae]|uniref:cupin domain-containing protein n=1 Tax=Actinospica robiniae TaxID=304901 RepID=UPI0003F5AAFD|nr:cupin domain-containing protein [Actinospica robiniae]